MSATKEIYLTANGQLQMEVAFAEETAWLSQAQMAELFGTKQPAISKHLRNIYQSGELQEQSTCSILEHMPEHGRGYKTTLYNLDAVAFRTIMNVFAKELRFFLVPLIHDLAWGSTVEVSLSQVVIVQFEVSHQGVFELLS